MMNIALLGNPNTGKTSLFNNLTGSYEYVGNWSGVTVEKKVGSLKNKAGQLIDLPGIYTLSPLSKDESVVSNFFINETFDGIVNIVDASQLERNLILTIQLLEFGKPTVIGLNMTDVAKHRGIYVNEEKLSKALNVPVISIVARTGEGCSQLSSQISTLETIQQDALIIDYGLALEKGIEQIIKSYCHINLWIIYRIAGLPYNFLRETKTCMNIWQHWFQFRELNSLYEETEQEVKEENNGSGLSQWIYRVRQSYISSIVDEAVDKKEL